MITDAQVHLYHGDSEQHPWPREAWRPKPNVPSFTASEYIAEMDAAGVDRAVIAPAAWTSFEDGLQTAIDAADQYPGRFAIMGEFDPCARDASDQLATWMLLPHMLGIRLVWVQWATQGKLLMQYLEDGGGGLGWFWEECQRLEIPLMCFTAHRVRLLEPIAKQYPHLPFIIDHMATKHAPSAAESFEAIDDLLRLAALPNVLVKASDAPNRSHEPCPFLDVHPMLHRIYRAFGAQRMLWGADVTQLRITGIPYADTLRLWQEGLPFLTEDDRDWILGRTAAEVLRWPEPPGTAAGASPTEP